MSDLLSNCPGAAPRECLQGACKGGVKRGSSRMEMGIKRESQALRVDGGKGPLCLLNSPTPH